MRKISSLAMTVVIVAGTGQLFAQAGPPPVVIDRAPRVQPEAAPSSADLARRRALRRTPIVEAVEAVRDSVVNISSTQIIRTNPWGGFFELPPEFESRLGGIPQRVKSAGSGFVLHSAGYIVTNAHVVGGTRDLKVTLADGQKSYDARVVAVNEKHDLAVLKVDADRPLRAAVLGTSSDLMIGETVIAIGNPFGFEHTVTSGVLSHAGRKIQLPNDPQERTLIQTDAAINPGNSGGPLLNILGEVIGVNTAIRGDAQNIGFAIPVDELRRFLPSILNINRVRLGVDLETTGAARVARVDAGSPAGLAGIRTGDLIVQIDRTPIAHDVDLFVAMMDRKPGDDVNLVIVRDGRRQRLTVELGARPDGARLSWSRLGMRLRDLTPEQATRHRLRDPEAGLLVYEVHEGGPAYEARIEPGDIVLQIEGRTVRDLNDIAQALDEVSSGDVVRLTIQRTEVGRVVRIQQFQANVRAK